MGIFKKEERLKTRTISGQELIQVLGYYARCMRQAVDMNSYTAETAALVEYHGQPYEVGLKYHTRKARKEGQIGFDTRYASFYIGKEAYSSLGEFIQYACMDGCRIADITGGIEVFPEVLEILDNNL